MFVNGKGRLAGIRGKNFCGASCRRKEHAFGLVFLEETYDCCYCGCLSRTGITVDDKYIVIVRTYESGSLLQ